MRWCFSFPHFHLSPISYLATWHTDAWQAKNEAWKFHIGLQQSVHNYEGKTGNAGKTGKIGKTGKTGKAEMLQYFDQIPAAAGRCVESTESTEETRL